MDVGPDGLPVSRSTFSLVLAVIGGVLLVGSAVWFVMVANIILTGGNDATCTDVKPDRHVGTIVGVCGVFYAICVIPAVFLLRKKDVEWAFFALVLALLSFAPPCGGLGVILFSIGMC